MTVGLPLMRRFAASLLLGFCVAVPGSALGDGDGVALHVRTVLATDSGSDFDTRLDGYRRQLRGLFHYNSYRLVKQEDRRCAFGRPNNFEIPGGRYLEVLAVQFRENRLKLRVLLIEGTSPPPLDTDFTVPNRGNIWVGGPRNPDGTLLISIGAEAMQ